MADELMTRAEVAKMLKCHPRTIARADADLQPIKIRGRPRYYKSDVVKHFGLKEDDKEE